MLSALLYQLIYQKLLHGLQCKSQPIHLSSRYILCGNICAPTLQKKDALEEELAKFKAEEDEAKEQGVCSTNYCCPLHSLFLEYHWWVSANWTFLLSLKFI